MTQKTETDYEATEQQIIELFEQLSQFRQSNLLDELIGIADLDADAEDSDDD